jgi:hypothetical protein
MLTKSFLFYFSFVGEQGGPSHPPLFRSALQLRMDCKNRAITLSIPCLSLIVYSPSYGLQESPALQEEETFLFVLYNGAVRVLRNLS